MPDGTTKFGGKCQGVKKDGKPCQFGAREGFLTCWRHRTQDEKLRHEDAKVLPLPKSPPKGEEE